MTPERIAVYGGSFDPPHAGHLLVATWVARCAPIDRLLVVPTLAHALGKGAHASFPHRVRMCELLVASLPNASVSDVENTLPTPSRTLATLESLARFHPQASFRLVVGADIAAQVARWHRWDEVTRIAPPLWVGRDGHETPDGATLTFPEVSSTEIRRRLAAGESVRGLVPENVLAYLELHGLYARTPSETPR